MLKKSIIIITIGLIGISTINTGCAKKEKINPEIKKQMQRSDEMKIKRDNRSRELKEMDVKSLVKELSAESQRGLEPFNSMAYDEVISRGSKAVPELSSILAEKPFFLGLLALRQVNLDEYRKLNSQLRIRSLVSSLEHAKFFNAFGVPHLYWEEAAKAIIDEGRGAKKYLIPLLTNKRKAPVWGSEGTIINKTYKYRVCDYAWKMLLDIDKKEIQIPKSPAKRDSLIKEYINSN